MRRRTDLRDSQSDSQGNALIGFLTVRAGFCDRNDTARRPRRNQMRRKKKGKFLETFKRHGNIPCYFDKPISFNRPRPVSPELKQFYIDLETMSL